MSSDGVRHDEGITFAGKLSGISGFGEHKGTPFDGPSQVTGRDLRPLPPGGHFVPRPGSRLPGSSSVRCGI